MLKPSDLFWEILRVWLKPREGTRKGTVGICVAGPFNLVAKQTLQYVTLSRLLALCVHTLVGRMGLIITCPVEM